MKTEIITLQEKNIARKILNNVEDGLADWLEIKEPQEIINDVKKKYGVE